MGTKAKVGLTVAVIAGAVGYMIYTTVSSGEALTFFKHVDEVLQDTSRWQDQQLQVHGHVVADSILKKPGSLDYKFAIHRGGQWLEVVYSGLVPDNFKDCAELVVQGKLKEPKTFFAKSISAKCPSRYDGRRVNGCGEALREQVMAHRQAAAR